jgi:hypothetical protein
MTPDDLSRRRPVWAALSDVFLDTETRRDFPRIARVLAESGYDEDEIVRIWQREAVPEFGLNLLDITGEWAALQVDERRLAARADTWVSLRAFVAHLTVGLWLRSQLRALLALRSTLATHPRDEWLAREKAWTAFAHVYLEESLAKVLFVEHSVSDLRSTGLTPALLTAAFESELRPIYRKLLGQEERPTETQRAANVIGLIAMACDRAPPS